MGVDEQIASLGIEVRSRSVRKGTKDLGGLERQARRTETAGGRLEGKWAALSRTMGRGAGVAAIVTATFYSLYKITEKATKEYAAFQKQVASVSTMLNRKTMGLDKYNRQLKQYETGLRSLSVSMGESTANLSKGLYDILSASVAPSKALDVLTVSVKAAKAGMTDTTVAVDFITSALNAYQMAADDAGKVSDIAFATVAQGKITFEELSRNIGKVAPAAAQAGVGLEQLGAMIATMTRQGIRAEIATTALNALFIQFARQTKQQREAWAEVTKGTELAGTAFNKTLLQGERLFKTLEVLSEASDNQRLKVAGETSALLSLNAMIADTEGLKKDLARTTNAAGETEEAYTKVIQILDQEMKKAGAAVDDFWRQLGEMVAPAATTLIKAFTAALVGLTDALKAVDEIIGRDPLAVPKNAGGEALVDRLALIDKDIQDRIRARNAGTAYRPGSERDKRIREMNESRIRELQEARKELAKAIDDYFGELNRLLVEDPTAGSGAAGTEKADKSGGAPSAVTGLTDEVKKAREKLERELELMGKDWLEKAKARLEQEKADLLASTKDKDKVNRWYYGKLDELGARSSKRLLAIEQASKTEIVAITKQTEEARSAAAKAGITGRIKLAQFEYRERLRKLDLWLADEQRKIRAQLKAVQADRDLANEERAAKEEALKKKLEAIDELYAARRAQIEAEFAKNSKSAWEKMLDDWSDVSKVMDETFTQAMRNIQDEFANAINDIIFNFDDLGSAWDSLMTAMKRAFANMLAQLISAWFSSGVAGLFKGQGFSGFSLGNLFGGGGDGNGFLNSIFNTGSSLKSAYDMYYGAVGGAGVLSGSTTLAADWAAINAEISAGAGAGAGVSALGGVAGGAAALYSAYQLFQLYENGPGGAEGAMQGMMTGAMGGMGAGLAYGAMTGTAAGPWGIVIGAIIGALVGGLGGGGSDDIEDRIADAERFYKIGKDLTRASNLDEDVDVDKYLEAVNAAHRSDNRVPREHQWALYNQLKGKDQLPWWAGNPDQVAHTRQLEGGTEWGQPQWMRYKLYGAGGREGETGDSGMAQWFGGDGEGAWGGQWEKFKEILDELSDETIDRLGGSITDMNDGLGMFGLRLEDLMEDITMAQFESGEWEEILRDRLQPASLLARMEEELRAQGLDNLTIAMSKQNAIIDTLTGSFDMSDEDMMAWIKQLLEANADVAGLSEKMKEYNEILKRLRELQPGDEEEAIELAKRARELREELGLGESAFNKVKDAMETLSDTMKDEVIPAFEALIKMLLDQLPKPDESGYHSGGYVYHSGGFVGAMLNAGMITPHGGAAYMHNGGLRPDERMAILQAGEYVIKRTSVNSDTINVLRSINATGRLPQEISKSISEINRLSQMYHTGGPVAPMPVAAPVSQPKGGDGGRPVVIHYSPQITVNAGTGADEAKIEAAVERALEKDRVALKRKLDNTEYQVVDAQ
jgi:TP901 family phage tail tape measure protein